MYKLFYHNVFLSLKKAREILQSKRTIDDMMAPKAAAHVQRFVYVIDDDLDLRKSLHFLLSFSHIIAWPFASAADFINQLPEAKPGPILLDIRMPDIDGLQLLASLKERSVNWPVIVMTAYSDVRVAVRAMKLGAIEFLEKPFQSDLLSQLLDQAFTMLEESEHFLGVRKNARDQIDLLSKRELEIVIMLAEGLKNKMVANRMGLSTRTVEMHRRNALAKLNFTSISKVAMLLAAADFGNPKKPPAGNLS